MAHSLMKSASMAAVVMLTLLSCAPKSPHIQNNPASQQDRVNTCRPELEPLPPSGEGMWPWSQLPTLDEAPLRARGLEVPLADLWTPGQGGRLKAAVGLRGCSASFISADGLMITNHHCMFEALQRNSSPDNDLIANGFVARSRTDELDGHGARAYVFQRQTDVTTEVLDQLPADLADHDRLVFIESREKTLVASCEEKPNSRCWITRNNDGLSFTLFESLELRDVRLVAAPPRSLADFGGEIDNWHWPRHGMDFSLARAYVAPDGSPADYSPDNVPYHPEQSFEISSEGLDQGDLVMVVGTPGRTRRYLTSAALEDTIDWYYPTRAELFERWITILEQTCADDSDACLPVSPMIKTLNNTLTNVRGTLVGLKRANLLERKRQEEAAWREWVAADPARQARLGGVLDALLEYLESSRAGRDRDILIRYMTYGAKGFGFARQITRWAAEQEKTDSEREPGFQERDRELLVADLREAQRSLCLEADKRLFVFFLSKMGALPQDEHLPAFDAGTGGDYSEAALQAYVDSLYQTTGLFDVDARLKLFDTPLADLQKSDDPLIELALALKPDLDAHIIRTKTREGALSRLRPAYIASLVEKRGTRFYPDANGSPRITFGTVSGYQPRDGVWYTPFTTLAGLLAKNTGEPPFDVPENILRAVPDARKSPYIRPDAGDVPMCFLSNSDTTGGNSGSPALNGKGELVGVNFDRVYENIVGDFGYNPALSRNIMVDIRAVLWYLDRIVHAEPILQELKIDAQKLKGG